MDFGVEVVERSRGVPVVVDFWAPWCGPCRTLGPVIEGLAEEAAGRWELVKLNTDEQPDVAEEYGIRGIPAVKMFIDGEVVAEFTGALPRRQIQQWLDAHLPGAGRARLDEVVAGWEAGGGGAIRPGVEAFLKENPDSDEARLRLAQALLAEDHERAREILRSVDPDDDLAELASDLESLAEVMPDREDAPEALRAALGRARDAFRRHDLDGTLGHLVDAAAVDRNFGDELARRAAVALFRLLGADHDLTREHRRRLGMVLHT